LGEGAFGQVYKGVSRHTSSSVAVKVIDLFMIKQEKNLALKEIKLKLSKN
jgi:serine/threonine protein kinase